MSQMPKMVRDSRGGYVFESYSIDYGSPDQSPSKQEEVSKWLAEYFSKKKVVEPIHIDESLLGPKN